MKKNFLLIAILAAQNAAAQNVAVVKKVIDSIVAVTEIGKSQVSHKFSIAAVKKVSPNINYHYQTRQGSIVKIIRYFGSNNDSTTQTFYFKNNNLVYSTEAITSYSFADNQRDSIIWIGSYYFSGGKLIDMVTLGHGKSETETWDPETEVLANCKSAKNDIARFNKPGRPKR
jgi:hypothetical protein